MARTEARYARLIRPVYPQTEPLEESRRGAGHRRLLHFARMRKACCGIRKVEPLGRALAGAAAWVTGLRADQSQAREGVRLVRADADRKPAQAQSAADWTRDERWPSSRRSTCPAFPLHELHEKVSSPSAARPARAPLEPGETERAGRWWWEEDQKKECGLHVGPTARLRAGRRRSRGNERAGRQAPCGEAPRHLDKLEAESDPHHARGRRRLRAAGDALFDRQGFGGDAASRA